ncbi:MAG: hypothetical protein ABIA83_01635, partial [Patescibacteria group bacterium]
KSGARKMKRAKSIFLRCGELVEQWRGWLPYWGFCSKKVRTSIKKHRQDYFLSCNPSPFAKATEGQGGLQKIGTSQTHKIAPRAILCLLGISKAMSANVSGYAMFAVAARRQIWERALEKPEPHSQCYMM